MCRFSFDCNTILLLFSKVGHLVLWVGLLLGFSLLSLNTIYAADASALDGEQETSSESEASEGYVYVEEEYEIDISEARKIDSTSSGLVSRDFNFVVLKGLNFEDKLETVNYESETGENKSEFLDRLHTSDPLAAGYYIRYAILAYEDSPGEFTVFSEFREKQALDEDGEPAVDEDGLPIMYTDKTNLVALECGSAQGFKDGRKGVYNYEQLYGKTGYEDDYSYCSLARKSEYDWFKADSLGVHTWLAYDPYNRPLCLSFDGVACYNFLSEDKSKITKYDAEDEVISKKRLIEILGNNDEVRITLSGASSLNLDKDDAFTDKRVSVISFDSSQVSVNISRDFQDKYIQLPAGVAKTFYYMGGEWVDSVDKIQSSDSIWRNVKPILCLDKEGNIVEACSGVIPTGIDHLHFNGTIDSSIAAQHKKVESLAGIYLGSEVETLFHTPYADTGMLPEIAKGAAYQQAKNASSNAELICSAGGGILGAILTLDHKYITENPITKQGYSEVKNFATNHVAPFVAKSLRGVENFGRSIFNSIKKIWRKWFWSKKKKRRYKAKKLAQLKRKRLIQINIAANTITNETKANVTKLHRYLSKNLRGQRYIYLSTHEINGVRVRAKWIASRFMHKRIGYWDYKKATGNIEKSAYKQYIGKNRPLIIGNLVENEMQKVHSSLKDAYRSIPEFKQKINLHLKSDLKRSLSWFFNRKGYLFFFKDKNFLTKSEKFVAARSIALLQSNKYQKMLEGDVKARLNYMNNVSQHTNQSNTGNSKDVKNARYNLYMSVEDAESKKYKHYVRTGFENSQVDEDGQILAMVVGGIFAYPAGAPVGVGLYACNAKLEIREDKIRAYDDIVDYVNNNIDAAISSHEILAETSTHDIHKSWSSSVDLKAQSGISSLLIQESRNLGYLQELKDDKVESAKEAVDDYMEAVMAAEALEKNMNKEAFKQTFVGRIYMGEKEALEHFVDHPNLGSFARVLLTPVGVGEMAEEIGDDIVEFVKHPKDTFQKLVDLETEAADILKEFIEHPIEGFKEVAEYVVETYEKSALDAIHDLGLDILVRNSGKDIEQVNYLNIFDLHAQSPEVLYDVLQNESEYARKFQNNFVPKKLVEYEKLQENGQFKYSVAEHIENEYFSIQHRQNMSRIFAYAMGKNYADIVKLNPDTKDVTQEKVDEDLYKVLIDPFFYEQRLPRLVGHDVLDDNEAAMIYNEKQAFIAFNQQKYERYTELFGEEEANEFYSKLYLEELGHLVNWWRCRIYDVAVQECTEVGDVGKRFVQAITSKTNIENDDPKRLTAEDGNLHSTSLNSVALKKSMQDGSVVNIETSMSFVGAHTYFNDSNEDHPMNFDVVFRLFLEGKSPFVTSAAKTTDEFGLDFQVILPMYRKWQDPLARATIEEKDTDGNAIEDTSAFEPNVCPKGDSNADLSNCEVETIKFTVAIRDAIKMSMLDLANNTFKTVDADGNVQDTPLKTAQPIIDFIPIFVRKHGVTLYFQRDPVTDELEHVDVKGSLFLYDKKLLAAVVAKLDLGAATGKNSKVLDSVEEGSKSAAFNSNLQFMLRQFDFPFKGVIWAGQNILVPVKNYAELALVAGLDAVAWGAGCAAGVAIDVIAEQEAVFDPASACESASFLVEAVESQALNFAFLGDGKLNNFSNKYYSGFNFALPLSLETKSYADIEKDANGGVVEKYKWKIVRAINRRRNPGDQIQLAESSNQIFTISSGVPDSNALPTQIAETRFLELQDLDEYTYDQIREYHNGRIPVFDESHIPQNVSMDTGEILQEGQDVVDTPVLVAPQSGNRKKTSDEVKNFFKNLGSGRYSIGVVSQARFRFNISLASKNLGLKLGGGGGE